MPEIRLYYECLEQALHFLKPTIENEIANEYPDITIRLVRSIRRSDNAPADSCLSAILSLVTPDILLTVVLDDREIPLVLVEFSEAVSVEDHELQRTYGACAAFFADMFYIKISGQKKSGKEFGGAKYDPYSTPRILSENLGWHGYIYAEWEIDAKNSRVLNTDEEAFSCPVNIPLVGDVIGASIKSVLRNGEGWFTNTMAMLRNSAAYHSHQKKLQLVSGKQGLLKEWRARQRRNNDRARLRFFVNKKFVAAKINRFSHAMDPDRGILIFSSLTFSSPDCEVIGVYALERQRTPKMKNKINNIKQLRRRAQIALTEVDVGGIPTWLATEIQRVTENVGRMNETIDFQDVWEAHMDQIGENKSVSTLVFFLDGLRLNHNGPLLKWDRRKLLGCVEDENLFGRLRQILGFREYWLPTPLERIRCDDINEDEVTYVLAHQVLHRNGFSIINVSYPGAQGGTPILPNPQLGKSQPREYIDIIALFPGMELRVLLNESKGAFSLKAIESDCKKLVAYRENFDKQSALTQTLLSVGCLKDDSNIRSIIIGVSFGGNSPTTWQPDRVDFIFIVPERASWKIGIFSKELADVIEQYSGSTELPIVYKVIAPTKNDNQGNLFSD